MGFQATRKHGSRGGWTFLTMATLLIGSLVLVACGAATPEPTEAPPPTEAEEETEVPAEEESEQEAEPTEPPQAIRIGVLNPTTGNLAVFGEQVNQGIQLYFDSIDNEITGVPVELVIADTGGDPQQALDQSRRLVQQENVDLLLGIVNSAVAVPVAQFADENEVPTVIAVGGATAATDEERSPFVFRTGMTNGQQDRPLGWYTATELERTQAATFAWDFLAGEERAGAFTENFTNAGGTVVAELKPPLGTTDYGPFISQVAPGSIDVAYAFFAGPGGVAFVQQMSEFGFTPDVVIVEPGFMATPSTLEAMGQAAVGIVQAAPYTQVLDNPNNEEFQSLYDEFAGGVPGYYVEEGFLASRAVELAIEAVGGDLSDTQAFLDAMATLEFEGPSGSVRFDDRGQAIRPVYIIQVVEGDDGSLAYEVIDTIEDVSQDWMP